MNIRHPEWLGALLLLLVAVCWPATGYSLVASADIRVLGLQVDLDTRPDIDGLQSTMTAVKNIPTGVQAVVGAPGSPVLPALAAGSVVRAELSGPALGASTVTLTAAPNGLMEIPPLAAAGEYRLGNVRLESADGATILLRDPARPAIVVNVIDKLLVTQVTSRPLTLDEIEEKGIVIDEDNFTALNFQIGLTLGSEQVVIDLPVAIPTTTQAAVSLERPDFSRLPSVVRQFDGIDIPNFSLSGFSLRPPPELKDKEIQIPPINGVIVIPGNIAFLNQFFSVVLQATNVAPDGSGLELRNARATIALPFGGDGIEATGDDPLRIAETRTGGIQKSLSLVDDLGADVIVPQATNQAEFLVEGLREGTHNIDFDIAGDLFVPALGRTVTMTGRSAGIVQVKNPTFGLVLAHPDVVREGESYSLFATVTNTSQSPANLFKLQLNSRSLSGARLADGESDSRTLDTLAPGQAETFEFRLVARTTGEVTGTVFLADEGINGSFILNTGVGDTGIPLSPDTLVLPQTVDYLPDDPDLVFAAVRLLGQAYSVATAPAGALPAEIARIDRSYVFDRAVKVAQAGLHIRFGESPLAASEDILMDFLGADLDRLTELSPGDPGAQAIAERNLRAFDGLRRAADAGHDLADRFAVEIGKGLTGTGLAGLQAGWAETFASRPAHLSFGISSQGPPVRLWLDDAGGQRLGSSPADEGVRREIPFAARLALTVADELLFVAAPESPAYDFAFMVETAGMVNPSLVLPVAAGGMEQVRYPAIDLPAGAVGRLSWSLSGPNDYTIAIDDDGDGSVDRSVPPESVTAIIDRSPRVLGVHQWGKGARPATSPDFASGDPIGRMIGVLFDEEVDPVAAERLASYAVAGNETTAVSLQPDRRLAFVILERPVGPFVARSLEVQGVADIRGHLMDAVEQAIAPDPDRGVGGRFSGRVVGADGRPIPFASIKYLQPLSFKTLFDACFADLEVRDFVIATYEADARGRFSIDYVLQSGFPTPDCPSNPDVWLNETNAGGTINFKLEATDPETGEIGKASSRIRFDGQHLNFDVIIRGFGAIEGDVFDEAGQPVVGGEPGALTVIARNVSTGETYASWVDATGHYAFPASFVAADGSEFDVPAPAVGNLILQIIRPADGFTAVATVNIPAAGAKVRQDLVMVSPNRFGTVTGRVYEADGTTGAANVPVQIAGQVLTGVDLTSRSFTAGVVGSTVTDSHGNFRFENVPAGDIEVRAFRQSSFEESSARSFLNEGDVQSVALVFPGSGGTVRGFVRDALNRPLAGAIVAGGPTLTKADANGFFEISGLPVGSFTIYGQGADSAALGLVRIDSLGASDVQDIVITLEPVGTITGTVFEADGLTPVVAQKVQLWRGNDGVMAETFTGNDGSYRFENYPLGDYNLRAVRADYGDGGQALTNLRFAGDVRDADIRFRGLGSISGRVVQSNGTPVLSDVIITRKVWRIITDEGLIPNVYLDYIEQLAGTSEEVAAIVDRVLAENNLDQPAAEFFFLVDEPVLIASDIRGPAGEVSGRFEFSGPVAGGPFTVAALGPFLSPAEVSGAIPLTAIEAERQVDVGDIVLEPATGHVTGTVFMPDGVTPAGEGVRVKIRSLDNSGDVQIPGASVSQPVLPEIDVLTDAAGRFDFPLVLRGRFVVTADSGVPDPAIRANDAASAETGIFADSSGVRQLNVRLYGQSNGVVPRGETLDIDIRLEDVAGVSVTVVENDGVTPAAFAEVTLTTASGLDGAAEAGFSRQITDANGQIDFFPVIDGRYSVSARLPGTPARGQASGEIPIDPPAGYVDSLQVTLGAVTTASGQVVQAQRFGTVEGTIFLADGRPLSNPAQVTVRASGTDLLTTTDASGRYRVDNVPAGRLTVTAFEPFTARRGTAEGRITLDGEVTDIPVTLVGLGTVTGEVFNNDGTRMLASVDVLLFPSGNFTDRLVSRTDARGIYRLPGVPLGSYRIQANDLDSGLTGEATGVMRNDGDTNTTDVYLEASGRIAGTVYAPGTRIDADGVPVDASGAPLTAPPVVADASVTISRGSFSQTVQTGGDGRFVSGQFLKTGRYDLTVRPIAGQDGATATAAITYEGQIAETVMVLQGQGVVEGVVVDSLGVAPVASARVTLHSDSPFFDGAVTRFTAADGSFRFDAVPVGRISLSIETTLQTPTLGGAAFADLAQHGQTISFRDDDADPAHAAIRLQDAGAITGRVLLADGVTLAAGAVVELRGGAVRLAQVSDIDGAFSFVGVPLGNYRLSIRDPASNGVAARVIDLLSNGQTIALGDVRLDADAPFVVSVLPEADSTGAVPDAPIVVTLSERIDPATVDTGTFIVRAAGEIVSGSVSVSPVEPVIAFTPSAALPDLTRIDVTLRADRVDFEGRVTSAGIHDLAGISLAGDYVFSYITADTTPPVLVSASPADGAREIDLASVLRFEFSEPIAAASLSALTVTADGVAVGGRVDIPTSFAGRVLVFVPDAPLLPNTTYRVRLAGPLTDLAGNRMSQSVIEINFQTIDTLAPIIQALAAASGQALIEHARVPVTATLDTAANDVAAVEFFIDGTIVAAPTTPPYQTTVELVRPAVGPMIVSAVAVDTAGNRSPVVELPLTVAVDQPPMISLTTPTTVVSLGQQVRLQVSATDDLGLAQIAFAANDGGLASASRVLSAVPFVSHEFTFTVPADLAVGSTITIQALAEDTQAQTTQATAVVLSVEDRLAPQVTIGSPANNTAFDPGATVSIFVRADDSSGISDISLASSGVAVTNVSRSQASAVSPASEIFTIQIPADALPTEFLTLTASARDRAGNEGRRSIAVRINDRIAPTMTLAPAAGVSAVEPGQSVAIHLVADDEIAVTRFDLTAPGLSSSLAIPVSPARHVEHDLVLTVPADQALGSLFTIEASAVDSAGNRSPVASLSLPVADLTPPSLSLLSPVSGFQPRPGSVLNVEVQASDAFAVASLGLSTSGVVLGNEQVTIDPAGPDASHVFTVAVPSSARAGRPLHLEATATDSAGNTVTLPILTLAIADIVPPQITAFIPADGAVDVDPGVVLAVRFDEAVAASTVNGVVLSGPAGPVATTASVVDGGQTIRLQPVAPLVLGADYTLTATTTVTDISGNALATAASARFTTVPPDTTPPAVVTVQPADGAVGVLVTASVTVTFSEALDPATVVAGNMRLLDAAGNEAPATVALSTDGRTLTLTPAGSLAFNADYRLLIAGLADSAGNVLAPPFASSFTTETGDITGPALQSLTPVDGAVDVSIRPVFRAVFDEALAPASTAAVMQLTTAGGTVVPSSQALVDGGTVVELKPVDALDLGGSYVLTLDGSTLTDAAGNRATASGIVFGVLSRSFSTSTFSIVSPLTDQRVGEGSRIELAVESRLDIDEVVFAVNGQALSPVSRNADPSTPAFVRGYTVPPLASADRLTIQARAFKSGSDLGLVDTVTVQVVPELQVANGLFGVPLAGSASLRLILSSPYSADLPVSLLAADPLIAALPASVVIPAGERLYDVPVSGLAVGNTSLRITSPLGDLVVIASVSEPLTGRQYPVMAAPVGTTILPAPSLGRIVVPAATTATLNLPFLGSAASRDTVVTIDSDNPAIVAVPGSLTLPAGSPNLALTLTTGADGQALVTLRSDGRVRELTVIVGAAPAGSLSPAMAAPVGVAVLPAPSLGRFVVPESATTTLKIPFLPTPVAVDTIITLASSDVAVAAVPASLVLAAGQTDLTLPVMGGQAGRAVIDVRGAGVVRELTIVSGPPAAGSLSPAMAAPVGVAILPAPSLGRVVVPEVNARTFRLPFLPAPAVVDTPVTVTSSDTSVASFLAGITIPVGGSDVELVVLTGNPGQAVLTLRGGGVVRELTVFVGEPAPGSLSPILAPPVDLAVVPASPLGRLVLPAPGSYSVSLPVAAVAGAADLAIDITSSDAAVAAVAPVRSVLPAGNTLLPLTIESTQLGQAELTLRSADWVRRLTVFIGTEPGARDSGARLAPAVGLEVQP